MVDSITPTVQNKFQLDQRPQEQASKELGQSDFLTLMTTQLRNQDPFKPMENGEFLGQMAQFSTVSGIEDMQGALEKMMSTFGANQTLQASQLIGQSVLVEGTSSQLDTEGSITGRFELPSSSGAVKIDVTDISGRLVREIQLGEKSSGRHDFTWDGMGSDGKRLPSGQYSLAITAASGDKQVAIPALLSRTIDSVEFGEEGSVLLNSTDGEVISLNDVKQIRQSIVAN